ncbi:MAG: hypothetical protein K2M76_04750 [Muribaculaceae bacterium]|nr:hypothetical protein [Muribaculaceae bacterium]
MRKLVLSFIVIVSVLSASAQRASEMDVTWHNSDDFARSGVFAEVAAGWYNGEWLESNGLGLSLHIGYRYNLFDNFCWDAIKVGINDNVSDFGGYLDIRFLTGVRYYFGSLPSGNPFYINAYIGYQKAKDSYYWGVGSGLAYEGGIGVCISERSSLGLCWEGSSGRIEGGYWNNSCTSNWGLLALKLGFQF